MIIVEVTRRMNPMNETLKFVKQFSDCVKEYRKLLRETDGTDEEIAHFFSAKNKSFLNKHKEEIRVLSTLNCERPFMTFVIHYIYM